VLHRDLYVNGESCRAVGLGNDPIDAVPASIIGTKSADLLSIPSVYVGRVVLPNPNSTALGHRSVSVQSPWSVAFTAELGTCADSREQ
jgi:hypothetical protein